MGDTLKLAYITLVGSPPDASLEKWRIAEAIVRHWDFQKLDEELAKKLVFAIVNHTTYPNSEAGKAVVRGALNIAREIWVELPDEPHVNQIEHLELRQSS